MTDEIPDALADLSARLFGRAPSDDQGDEPTGPPNYVPTEGNNPDPGPGADLAAFVAALFNNH